ncbi:hypothetical protein ADK54_03795 [Streptomyces sp. WM6378]|nr:hypothetical protein ADK54_03795 [Streptomyces sp. WM6378]
MLGEGVDITGERGVEAICFADTRGSQVEIVQNIGRALRPNRDGSTKVARIIVPVSPQALETPLRTSAEWRRKIYLRRDGDVGSSPLSRKTRTIAPWSSAT